MDGMQSGATLSVRTWLVDFAAFLREERDVHEGIKREARKGEALAAERQRQGRRLQVEARLLEEEMEADARLEASVQAGRVMRDMREQLLGLVEEQAAAVTSP